MDKHPKPKPTTWYKVKGQLCGCLFKIASKPLPWTNYVCKVCGKETNLIEERR